MRDPLSLWSTLLYVSTKVFKLLFIKLSLIVNPKYVLKHLAYFILSLFLLNDKSTKLGSNYMKLCTSSRCELPSFKLICDWGCYESLQRQTSSLCIPRDLTSAIMKCEFLYIPRYPNILCPLLCSRKMYAWSPKRRRIPSSTNYLITLSDHESD